MEVVAVDSVHYQVQFNGAPISCFHDTECPGVALCAINQTWSAVPGGWCTCNWGWQGANCDQLCPYGQWLTALMVFDLLVGLAVTILALVTARRFALTYEKGSKLPLPLLCILVFSGLGVFIFTIHAIVSIVIFAGFPYIFNVYLSAGRQIRRISPEINLAGYMLYGFASCIGVCSLIVLPLTWIGISTKVLTLSKKAKIGFNIWATLFILLTLFAQLPLYIMAPVNFAAQQVVMVVNIIKIWTAVLTVIMALNVCAFIMGTVLQKNRKALTDSVSTSGNIEKLIWRIKLSAAIIVIMALLIIITLFYMIPAFIRTVVSDPRCDITFEGSALRLGIMAWECAFATPLWFVYTTLQHRHSTRVVSTNNKVSSVVNASGA